MKYKALIDFHNANYNQNINKGEIFELVAILHHDYVLIEFKEENILVPQESFMNFINFCEKLD